MVATRIVAEDRCRGWLQRMVAMDRLLDGWGGLLRRIFGMDCLFVEARRMDAMDCLSDGCGGWLREIFGMDRLFVETAKIISSVVKATTNGCNGLLVH